MSTPSTSQYESELDCALQAVHAASLLTKSVLRSLKNKVGAETKADDSPVTIADFAAQALLISALHAVYPQDRFIGEESADALRQNEPLADRVWQLVLRARDAKRDAKGGVQQSRDAADDFPASREEMFDLIDRGGKGEVTGQGRVWVMDPVDGTATFMQGQQYAVALCLLVDGVQQVGVVGCPNLAFDVHGPLGETRVHEDQVDETGYGVVLSAVKEQGTYVRSMQEYGLGEARRVDLTTLPAKPLTDLNFVEATIGKTSLSQAEHKAVAESLGATWPGTVVWSQQMKYIALALGATDVMVRIPKTKERYTYIWDHAGGHILFQEAGGKIADFDGEAIDFSRGRQIKGEANHGMVASLSGVFAQVDAAVKDVMARRDR
ncbi:carbohydrate phosphatase [Ophiobolus disseminans]|uniref:Carbohydrate phosphatase n=1 Tax=Ophiobolus disseminans TaxID=1469910 RepID=A0A6A7ALF6_9PLEO|nr:carbohydrate phosphatase [Ophiobolus disseminans]